MEETKTCLRCQQEKDVSGFYANRIYGTLDSTCKCCRIQISKLKYHLSSKFREQRKAYSRKYYAKKYKGNPDGH